MITEYLHEPRLNRKIPANNYKQKSYRLQDSVQKFNTMETNCVSSAKRAFSTNNIGRKTI